MSYDHCDESSEKVRVRYELPVDPPVPKSTCGFMTSGVCCIPADRRDLCDSRCEDGK